MKISPFSYANATIVSFKNNNKTEYSKTSHIGYYCHETYFFREKETDEMVQNYIRDNFASNNDIHIVSAGCSSGEEAISYSMMLDDLKDKVRIDGFDVSLSAINDAKKGFYTIRENDDEGFLIEKNWKLDDYSKKCYEKFNQYFDCVDKSFVIYRPKAKFQLKKDAINNCNFFQGNLCDLSSLFKRNDVDVLLLRNTLYHLPDYWLDNIIKQAHQVIKPNGLIVFGEIEDAEGVDTLLLEKILFECGFRPIIYKNAQYNDFYNVWKKMF